MLFRDLVQKALKDGRLKFVDKQKPQPEEQVDPKVEDAFFVELVHVLMVDITDDTKEVETSYEEKMKEGFPRLRKN